MMQHAQWEAFMKMFKSISKICTGMILAGMIAISGSSAASAQTVTTNFLVQNSFGSTITLDSASCSPSASISAPFSIGSGSNASFSATSSGGTLLCTVRYQNGSNGCQFQVDVNVIGGNTTGYAIGNAYKGGGGHPTCNYSSFPGTGAWSGSFTMQ
jgi:hypothetical protein